MSVECDKEVYSSVLDVTFWCYVETFCSDTKHKRY